MPLTGVFQQSYDCDLIGPSKSAHHRNVSKTGELGFVLIYIHTSTIIGARLLQPRQDSTPLLYHMHLDFMPNRYRSLRFQ